MHESPSDELQDALVRVEAVETEAQVVDRCVAVRLGPKHERNVVRSATDKVVSSCHPRERHVLKERERAHELLLARCHGLLARSEGLMRLLELGLELRDLREQRVCYSHTNEHGDAVSMALKERLSHVSTHC